MAHLEPILLIILLTPLVGGLIAGVFGKQIGRAGAHWVTSVLVAVSLALSIYLFCGFVFGGGKSTQMTLFTWALVDHLQFNIGFLVDRLTVFMLIVVNFVSFLVHIYSIGYMADDDGYQRFFSYISSFTFAMLSLVMADNFLLLFFGWEGVGLVSYLLIGFWFKREKSNFYALKAFIANRVGDLGFLLGIAAVLMYFGSLNYLDVFKAVPSLAANAPMMHIFGDVHWHVISVICILLFVGAIGKSAQIPLHVWLEGSMEGPTPISALIHAATMVTAGVFMVARLSPMFEFSTAALSTVLVIGAATCFLMGILGIVQNDIKRVIAYSTLSQLGYMVAAQGASAFSIGMFHLMSHAAFKALLFLAAGSVIVGMHHEQDIRKMGGLAKRMPITYVCMLFGALALAAIPPFSGFFSKDLIIEAVQASTIPGHSIASFFVVGGAFVTAVYTFRMFFIVFHGKSRLSDEHDRQMKESPLTILIPLICLAIPALLIGVLFFVPSLNGFFGNAIYIAPQYDVVAKLQALYHSPWQFFLHGLHTLPFWLAIAGIAVTFVFYVLCPAIPQWIATKFRWIHTFLVKKYFFEDTLDWISCAFAKGIGYLCWVVGDIVIIDKGGVEGSAKTMRLLGRVTRRLQTGYLYHYAFAMIIGLLVLLGWVYLNN